MQFPLAPHAPPAHDPLVPQGEQVAPVEQTGPPHGLQLEAIDPHGEQGLQLETGEA